MGVVADVHGNVAALEAILADAADLGVERWWALGDLVLFGPRPVEVLLTLADLPGIEYVSGNTDRYVVTGEQPHPHATPVEAAGDVELVDRYAQMAGAIGWTRGALCQAGLLDALAGLPSAQRVTLPDGSVLLGIHASPGADDGPGIDTELADDVLSALLSGAQADIVIGGHTHDATDRMVGGVRALNPGSAGLPRRCVGASWMLVEADETSTRVQHRQAGFDVDEVILDLHRRGYPNASFVESILNRTRRFAH